MSKANKKKTSQLGMPIGTASNRLRKMLLFHLVKLQKLDNCVRCNEKIENIKHFSIEHKTAWLDSENPVELFFDLENIAFSHLSCNVSTRKIPNKGNKSKHGTRSRYVSHKCRCDKCKKANAKYMENWRID